jgi:DMSO/TMAO reductase YedYZ molybdopterin-dependent catalytic subunit
VLNAAGVRDTARWLVYYSSDPDWWESIDIDEAMHAQTLVTWGMNGADLPVPFGGPLRLRVPRQLGYKSVKFLDRLILTDSLAGFGVWARAVGRQRRLRVVRGHLRATAWNGACGVLGEGLHLGDAWRRVETREGLGLAAAFGGR